MLGHLGIRVPDLEASTEFYSAILSPLSYTTTTLPEVRLFGPSDKTTPIPNFMLRKFTPSAEVPKPSPVHISFYAKTRKEVDEFYRRGIEVGGRGNGEPGFRSYMKGYYGMFVVLFFCSFFFLSLIG
jgi:predicted lactoylglutathione lyase